MSHRSRMSLSRRVTSTQRSDQSATGTGRSAVRRGGVDRLPPSVPGLHAAGNRAVSSHVAVQRKPVDAVITTKTKPRIRPTDRDSLVHGRSGKEFAPDSHVAIHDNKPFTSRLETDEAPEPSEYRENPKDTVWYKMVDKVDGLDAYIRTGTFRLDPAGADVASMMKVYTRQGMSFKARITRFIEDYGATATTIDDVRPFIEKATQDERDTVSQDTTLMNTARLTLKKDVYLALLPALRVYNQPDKDLSEATPGWTEHMKAPVADQHIQGYMQDLGLDAVTKGRRVEGEVSVVGGKDWDDAFFRQWGPFGYTDSSVCNAFVDVNLPKRHIWVNKNWGNAGTVLHEGMHKYADPTLRDSLISQYKLAGVSTIDEGLTELFTRKVTEPLGIIRGNYPNDHEVMEKLATRVGNATVQQAYFAGKYTELIDTFDRKTKVKWDTFSSAMETKKYSTAKSLI